MISQLLPLVVTCGWEAVDGPDETMLLAPGVADQFAVLAAPEMK
jgi:hypothetical protein